MGAAESNAGDDFHFWWAATRALALIEPGTASRVVVVEGLSRVDDPDDEYEAVDVSEYVGGDTFDTASDVLLSQLKYSTRHPDKPWTASRLCERRTRRGVQGKAVSTRSVIGDLAGIYATLLEGRSPDELLRKVRISLVSNQPGDTLLIDAIATARAWARSRPDGTGKAALFKALPEQHEAVVRKLATGIGARLQSSQFCDFFAVLDLSQTGALNRAALARGVHAGMAELAPGRGGDSARRLFDLVRREAMPDSSRDGIRACDVLAELGVADQLDLYPAPTRLAPLDDPLAAPGAAAMAAAVLANPGAVVVAHGSAGAGKTTAVQQLEGHLPSGSVVELFDCYGGGEYLSPGEERHTTQRFVTQTVNDLAQRCGTPLVVHPPAIEDDLWRRLRRTLERAVDALDPDAVLVLAVDAADNAVFAASQRSDRGFVAGLVGMILPARVTVLLTARSHRVESLGVAQAVQVELAPFDAATSAAHLRRYRAAASDSDAAEFHSRTDGNPRTQYYALTQASSDNRDIPSLLAACSRTPDALFEDLVDSGLQVSGADAGGQRWLALMLALARPISTDRLATALGVSPSAVVAFGHGLAPGVSLVDGAIQFRDEDFETYVRGRVDPADVVEAHNLLADMFLAVCTSDADAAANVADHLYAAGRHGDVLQLVLDEDWPEAIPDGFRRGQVQGRRLDLAARAAAEARSRSAAVRVAVRACDTASRLNTLSSLVETRLDLVARYTDVDQLRTYALRQSAHGGWLAPMHMRLAAALARDPARHAAARAELESADAWLRRWTTGPKEETRSWDINPEDVASAAEARYRLDGLDAAIGELRRWRPTEFALDAAAALTARVAAEVGAEAIRGALHAHSVETAAQAPFLAYAVGRSAVPNRDWVDQVVAAVLAVDRGEIRPWHWQLIDVAMRHGDRPAAAALARHWAGPLPSSHRWGFGSGDQDGVSALRAHAIAAVLDGREADVEDLVPPSLRPKDTDNDPRGHERREWTETVRPILAAAHLAARAAVGEADGAEVAAFIDAGLADRKREAEHRWFTFDRTYKAWAALVTDAAVDAAAAADVIARLTEAATTLVRDGAAALWLDFAGVLSRRGTHPNLAADLCAKAAARARADAYSAPDRLDLLARAAEIAGDVGLELGRHMFDLAVDAATGINDDSARLLAVHADLADRAKVAITDRPGVAARLVRAAEAVAPYVTDSGVIPYEAVARAAGRLDAGVALAAVSRWDDEDRIGLMRTLPAALRGAVDGGGVVPAHALLLDHLMEDDRTRLQYQLDVIDRLRAGAAGVAAARLALQRAVHWIRRDVPARVQPALAAHLLGWSSERGLDGNLRVTLDLIAQLGHEDVDDEQRWTGAGLPTDLPEEVRTLLSDPGSRSWTTLADDVAALAQARVYGEEMRGFVAAVARAAQPGQRVDALAAVADLPVRVGADLVVPVLVDCLEQWKHWPGVAAWATATLPTLLARHLVDLGWRTDTGPLLDQLRLFGSDDDILVAVVAALPDARLRLTSYGWQNIAALLGRLCGPEDAADVLTALLAERLTDTSAGHPAAAGAARTDPIGPIPLVLWSMFGHPRRGIRWRAAHATRELLVHAGSPAAVAITAELVSLLGRADAGPYRDPDLHFYSMSATAALLSALARVAVDKPALLAAHLDQLTRHATSRDLPHAQIRELARWAALAAAHRNGPGTEEIRLANQPAACFVHRDAHHREDDRNVSDERRYDFDRTDTIPYWYAPLAQVFDLPVDSIAEKAERWIIDKWGHGNDDWWTDRRELRDQRSYERTGHRHGSIPPEENLRLYLEYHAMFAVAGELVDERRPIRITSWDDDGDPWCEWLAEHLPVSAGLWLADLRGAVPAEPDLFGQLPPLDAWDIAELDDYDCVIGHLDGRISEQVLVAANIVTNRPGAYSKTYVRSALVAPAHAAALQRALSAASNPIDWKLPSEDETQFEVNHGQFVLRGWLDDSFNGYDTLDEHDSYAHDTRRALPLPGREFRDALGATSDPAGLALRGPDGAVLAAGQQWADADTDDAEALTSSGYRVYIAREPLLRYLAASGMTLILEVQIGRHRRNTSSSDYRLPRSRIYLIDATGAVSAS